MTALAAGIGFVAGAWASALVIRAAVRFGLRTGRVTIADHPAPPEPCSDEE